MRTEIASVTLQHWCNTLNDPFVHMTINIRARTKEQVEEVWNKANL